MACDRFLAPLSSPRVLLLLILTTYSADHVDGRETLDLLEPYQHRHGSTLSHRQVRECQPAQFDNVTHQLYPVWENAQVSPSQTFVQVNTFAAELDSNRIVKGHYALVAQPLHTASVLQPVGGDGCKNHQRGTVAESGRQKKCLVAMNAGFFNTSTGACLGNIVSDGRRIQTSGAQNAQFGLTKQGQFFVGYLSEEQLLSDEFHFQQLVSGVVWLVRDGEIYIENSKKVECPDIQETGNFDRFVNVISARTAVGHDKEGRLMLLHVEGKTDQEGVNLWELAGLMKQFGAINAINTDGGGSATFVINGTTVSYPSDDCHDQKFLKCARNVSTVFCIHEPDCDSDCGHGECQQGACICQTPWLGTHCSELPCHQHNCSHHGRCTVAGCQCDWGWTNDTCNQSCSPKNWGPNCMMPCQCANNAACHPVDGSCHCAAGFHGVLCEQTCPFGWYGLNCSHKCICSHSCPCNHLTGVCDGSYNQSLQQDLASCLVEEEIRKQDLVPNHKEQYRLWLAMIIVASCLAFMGLLSTSFLLYLRCSDKLPSSPMTCNKKERVVYTPRKFCSESSDSEEKTAMLLQ